MVISSYRLTLGDVKRQFRKVESINRKKRKEFRNDIMYPDDFSKRIYEERDGDEWGGGCWNSEI